MILKIYKIIFKIFKIMLIIIIMKIYFNSKIKEMLIIFKINCKEKIVN